MGSVNSQQLRLAWPAEFQPAPWLTPRTDKAFAMLEISPAFVSKRERLLSSLLMASPRSLGLLTSFGHEESERELGPCRGRHASSLPQNCPANADLYSSDTHQI